jgi:D-alanyl-D-alanine carboxypeptidase
MKDSFARSAMAVLLTATTFTAAACGESDSPPPNSPELDATAISEIEAIADRAVLAGIPGVALVIQAGSQTVRIARGVEDRTTGAPITPDHRFREGSVAKSILSSIVLQMVDEGKLRLSDTVDSQLPGMVSGNNHATIEQLMRLQSGIYDHANDPRYLEPYLGGDFEYVYTPQQLLALSNDHPPVFPPGERFMYSNTNYTIIGLIIEKQTGLSLAQAVAQRITSPLGMTHTSMPLNSEMESPYAHGYLVGMGDPIDVTRISASSTFGHGNIVSTAGDLNTFYAALVAGKVVNPARLEAMFTPDPSIATNYGMGVWVWDDFPCGAWIGHDGATAGYDTFSYSRRDGRRQVTVQVSSLTMDDKAGDEAAHTAWRDLIVAAACK